jgi:hypothetical protein
MDVAYDHIQEELLPQDEDQSETVQNSTTSLNSELQQAYETISKSAWGARLGGFFGTVRKQVGHRSHEVSMTALMSDENIQLTPTITSG